MHLIYQNLTGVFSPKLILLSCSYLKEEDNFKVEKAVSNIVSGLAYSILTKGGSSEVEFILRKSGRAFPDMESKFENIFYGNADEKIYYLGSQFLDSLYVTRVNTFISLVSKSSGLSIRSTDKLISMIAPVVSGFLGNKIIKEKISFEELISRIENEKESFESMIPSGLADLANLSENKYQAVKTDTNISDKYATPSKNNNFIYILLILLLILAGVFFIWKLFM